jgi:hypothetical protein
MLVNATFNNSSAISWRLVSLVEETEGPGENYQPAASHQQTWSQNIVLSTPRLSGIRTHNLVVIDTDCIGSCKSNYHTITTTTAPWSVWNQTKIVNICLPSVSCGNIVRDIPLNIYSWYCFIYGLWRRLVYI